MNSLFSLLYGNSFHYFFQAELIHFEHRMQKLRHFEDRAGDGLKKMKKEGINVDRLPVEEQEKLNQRANDYAKKVCKYIVQFCFWCRTACPELKHYVVH